jgi:glycosyltransferase involved in cell wall biosynthesis
MDTHDLEPFTTPDSWVGSLSALADPLLASVFWRAERLGAPSAWWEHVPFAHWIVCATAPRLLVELGTHTGVSYSAFCQAVAREQLPTRCHAVDTWRGDPQSGEYGEEVYEDLRHFHDERFGAFSTLLRCTFEDALDRIEDGSIDLLHIDGYHTYEAVHRDFHSWLPKLSDRAIVIFHDINERLGDFGVWRLWNELREQQPSFEFLHGHGLGILAVGKHVPAAVAALCELKPPAVAAVRTRFARLGERWLSETREHLLRQDVGPQLAAASGEIDRLQAEIAKYAGEMEGLRAVAARAAAALAEPIRDRQADIAARAAADGALAHAVYRCNAETTARVAAEAALADAAQRLQAAAAERAATNAIVAELRASQRYAATALATATSRLRTEEKARNGLEAALTVARRRHDEAVRARIAETAALAQARHDIVAAEVARDNAVHARDSAQHARDSAQHARDTARSAQDLASAELATARSEIATLRWERGIILGSTLWRATEPVRQLGRAISRSRRQRLRRLVRGLIPRLRRETHPEDHLPQQRSWESLAPPEPDLEPGPAEARPVEPGVVEARAVEPGVELQPASPLAAPVVPSPMRRVMFISGEPDTPGHVYRVRRFADAASATGAQVTCLTVPETQTRLREITGADVVVIWRALDSVPMRQIIAAAREGGAKLVYDLDDLMFKPELARLDIIDGIRSMRLTPEGVAAHYASIRDVLVQADVCTCTTEEMARHIREYQKVAVVLANGFDAETLCAARHAVRRRRAVPRDDVVRIGYATGSRTHQRDFAQVADALARVLRERPATRLVLFRDADRKEPVLLIEEFPVLSPFADQVEWRDMVPLEQLPAELARFDINLAPIELDNVFCEAKSELKYFEAALVGVCTIASPTGPFRRAIRPGETGLLAVTSEEWYAAIIALIDDVEARTSMARSAYLDVLWRHGPEQRIEQVRSLLDQLRGDRSGARAFQLELCRQRMPRARNIGMPDSEVVFSTDALGEAEVTVAIQLYNYANYVIEALESVRAQTLTPLDLVVVDDASTDASVTVVLDWVRLNAERFNRVVVLHNRRNAGLGVTRNAAFDATETPYVVPLDADNLLRPTFCAVCLEAIRGTGAAFAYPMQQHFGDTTGVIGIEPYHPMRFVGGNYIDAMALVAKSAWAAAGGYDDIPCGWEDYELWCSFVERGLWGVHVPQILADYRVHAQSMLRTLTSERTNKLWLIGELERRHPWLGILDGV